MDIYAIRLKNYKMLLTQCYDGVKAQMARDMGISPNNLSRYESSSPEHRRNIGDEAARTIERICKKPRGWMDTLHSDSSETTDISEEIKDFDRSELAELLAYIDLMKRRKRGEI